MDTLLVVLVLLGFGAPWTWFLYRRSAGRRLEDAFDCVCFGYALSFVLLFVSAQLRLWLFVPLWAGGALGCVALARSRPREPLEIGPQGRILLACSGIYLVLRCLPFTLRRLPLGWDAYFHMTISESIVERGRAVHDWLPFEDIPLNYPIGSHLLLALTQWSTGVRPHQFFELLVVLFTLLSGLQLYSLCTRATGDRNVGCYAALAYLFLGNFGSLQYALWSGLPNLIGMYLFLGLLTALTREAPSRVRGAAVFVVYFLGACFVHHHVMVTAGLCLVWTGAAAWMLKDEPAFRRIADGLVASALVGSPYFVMYALRTIGLKNTGIAEFNEDIVDAWVIAKDVGIGFAISVLAGLYLYFANQHRVSHMLLQPLIAMVGLYVAVEFVCRTASIVLLQHELAPFTPSRFMTDAVTLLSVFAGIFFRTMQSANERQRVPLTALILAGFWIFNRGTYQDTFAIEIDRDRRATYAWIREHTAPDAVLLDADLHATYLTRRMSSSFPLPTSEYSALARNRQLLERIAAGQERPERAAHQVLAVVEPGQEAPAGAVLFEQPSGIRVVERFAPRADSAQPEIAPVGAAAF